MFLRLVLPLVLAAGWTVALEKNLKFPFDLPKGYGPWVHPTAGQVWPQPQMQNNSNSFMVLRPNVFQFQISGKSCDILDEALRRYYELIFWPARGSGMTKRFQKLFPEARHSWEKMDLFRGYLDTVKVHLMQPCETYPSLDMDEHYEIKLDSEDRPLEGMILSSSIWGILRGLESFSQLTYPSQNGAAFQINSTLLMDFPRFAHRGLMLDTSRHFLPLKVLKQNLDLMAQNKFNVFHWHLTDEPSFPYVSTLFPSISRLGSFNQYSHVYTPKDVQEIIEYARMRGIRVIPEFDTPGHTQSWGPGVPDLLTRCFDKNAKPLDYFGPINPILAKNYKFLKQFFSEVFSTFPDSYVHLGGDEVEFDCWASNPDIQHFMEKQGWGKQFERLEQYYMQKLINDTQNVTQGQMEYLVWQEVVDNNVILPRDTVVHVWKDGMNFKPELSRVTGFGYRTLLSSPWYLNYINYGVDWDRYYNVEPLAFVGTEAQKRLVIGGEACMWGEFVDAVSVIPRTWPRASAVAERLWSHEKVNSAKDAAPRLEEHRCRLLRRGFNVDPINGVGFCDVEWD